MRIPHHRSGHSESDKNDKRDNDASEGNAALKVSTRYDCSINLEHYGFCDVKIYFIGVADLTGQMAPTQFSFKFLNFVLQIFKFF